MRRLFLACLTLVLLAGCAPQQGQPSPSPSPEVTESPSPSPMPSPTPNPSPSPSPSPTDPYAGMTLNPLTGLPLDEAYLHRRPAAIMLNNLKKALPMYGVTQADIIYEALAEGGITRMVGVYQNPSQVPQIGTVRSTRAYYLDIATGHDAILLHAGGSPEAYDLIRQRGMAALDCLRGYEGSLFWRDKDRIKKRGLEHSAFTSGERIEETFQKLKTRIVHEEGYKETLQFADDGTPVGGTPATSVSIKYSYYKTGVFDYNSTTKTYAVTEYDAPYIDGQDNSQVNVTNVLVLYASVGQVKGDDKGRLVTKLTGDGTGTFICGGRSVPIKWSKESYAAPFIYTLENSSPLLLGRGHSYINIVPLKAAVEIK